ncbi:MAG TPA: hypothetical protein VNK91_10280 [Burkholderiaceae bacterium]|nr:hypothetical protein [Burkholderiaceae bacterium]
MTATRLMFDGIAEAARLVPLLFTLNTPAAPPVAPVPDAAAAPVLIAQHLEVAIDGERAALRVWLTYRNEGESPVALGDLSPSDGSGDPVCAELEDAAGEEPRAGALVLAPGAEATVVLQREATALARGARRRVVMPLPESAAFIPQFSAEVTVASPRPIVHLASATHGGEASGLGTGRARLLVANGRAYEARFFAVEFELGAAPPSWGGEARGALASVR